MKKQQQHTNQVLQTLGCVTTHSAQLGGQPHTCSVLFFKPRDPHDFKSRCFSLYHHQKNTPPHPLLGCDADAKKLKEQRVTFLTSLSNHFKQETLTKLYVLFPMFSSKLVLDPLDPRAILYKIGIFQKINIHSIFISAGFLY